MPLDAICLQGVVEELSPQITGSRIEKIQQPARDQVVLLLRGSRRLYLNAGGSQPRLHLTEQVRDNPSQPPMFCMLLRKHLSGGVIEFVRQEPLERVAWTLVLGGGIGNLIDRVATGVVVDYINVLFVNFAIFNFADICVCVGVGLLMVWEIGRAHV